MINAAARTVAAGNTEGIKLRLWGNEGQGERGVRWRRGSGKKEDGQVAASEGEMGQHGQRELNSACLGN